MQFALLVYESPEAFASRNNTDEADAYLGAWRAYHKALVEAGILVGGDPLQGPETATTVRLKEGKRRVQDGPLPHPEDDARDFSPTSVQFKSEINDALPLKRHQKRHLEFCTAHLRSRMPQVRVLLARDLFFAVAANQAPRHGFAMNINSLHAGIKKSIGEILDMLQKI